MPARPHGVARSCRQRDPVLPIELVVEIPVGATAVEVVPTVGRVPTGRAERRDVHDHAIVFGHPAFVAMAAAPHRQPQLLVHAALHDGDDLLRVAHHLDEAGAAHPSLVEAANQRRVAGIVRIDPGAGELAAVSVHRSSHAQLAGKAQPGSSSGISISSGGIQTVRARFSSSTEAIVRSDDEELRLRRDAGGERVFLLRFCSPGGYTHYGRIDGSREAGFGRLQRLEQIRIAQCI